MKTDPSIHTDKDIIGGRSHVAFLYMCSEFDLTRHYQWSFQKTRNGSRPKMKVLRSTKGGSFEVLSCNIHKPSLKACSWAGCRSESLSCCKQESFCQRATIKVSGISQSGGFPSSPRLLGLSAYSITSSCLHDSLGLIARLRGSRNCHEFAWPSSLGCLDWFESDFQSWSHHQ